MRNGSASSSILLVFKTLKSYVDKKKAEREKQKQIKKEKYNKSVIYIKRLSTKSLQPINENLPLNMSHSLNKSKEIYNETFELQKHIENLIIKSAKNQMTYENKLKQNRIFKLISDFDSKNKEIILYKINLYKNVIINEIKNKNSNKYNKGKLIFQHKNDKYILRMNDIKQYFFLINNLQIILQELRELKIKHTECNILCDSLLQFHSILE